MPNINAQNDINLNEYVEKTHKELMLSFIVETLELSSKESRKLKGYAHMLSDKATLPEFIAYLNELNVEADLLEKLKFFGR